MVLRSKVAILSGLVIASVALWFANTKCPNIYLQNGFYSFLALTVIYFIFKIFLESMVSNKIKDPKTRYSLKKILSIFDIATFLIVVMGIWVENLQDILIAYGLIGAAVAFALQDLIKNLMGGIVIFLNGIYRVGDRIEINQKYGDVIDVNLFYTTLLEMKDWVPADQATGRLTSVPNGYVLNNVIHNYTRDFGFIWDEIAIPITYDSDWNEATNKILEIVERETKVSAAQAEKDIAKTGEKYYLTKRSVDPTVFLTLTDNWINFNIRYVTEIRERRLLHDKLSRMILDEIQKSKNIKIASTTLNITGFPDVNIKQ
ncbi:MAG: mechanosensitive ion channel [Candidatus Bathyarchaeota archaeon]|nr:mechanosensitive ion channel [Candidatus Bathyarchaeum tardum]WGM90141.1 MAG: mechanosensitive ion channel [Candidatus Bathyarchaeum tardum]WNZ29726.1 MAG: mechanosensitive ion channel [Candidatus Bathyarchaeota archaeon]